MSSVSGLPLPGYKPQTPEALTLVAEGKVMEERVLRYIERVFAYVCKHPECDARFTAIGRTDIQKGFMMVYRGVMNPSRIDLPEDNQQAPQPEPVVGAVPGEQAPNA